MILEIYGEIGWWPNTLEAIKERVGVEKVERVDIFSPGGEVFEGLAIAEYVRSIKAPTRGVGFVGSIATAILLAGKRVSVTEDSILFVHRPAFDSAFYPDAADLERMKSQLEAIEEVLVSIYARRLEEYAGGQEEARQLAAQFMDEQRFFTAKEAKELGLVDKIEAAAKIENSNHMALRAVAKFRDMNLLDKIKEKLAGLYEDEPRNDASATDNAPATGQATDTTPTPDGGTPGHADDTAPEPVPASTADSGEAGQAPAGDITEALGAIMERIESFEKTVAEVRERIEEKESRIEELAQATELIGETLAKHLGRPMNTAKTKNKPTGEASPFDAIAKAFRK